MVRAAGRGAALVRGIEIWQLSSQRGCNQTGLKQAAAGNYSTYGFYLTLLLAKAIDSRFADRAATRWVILGSRLFRRI
jgi:hypothetical protein